MGRCQRCKADIDDGGRFCPFCGAPQTEDAARQLDQYVKSQIEPAESRTQNSDQVPNRRPLWDRICYVVGYLTIVIGLSLSSSIEGKLFLFAGLFILPPMRRFLGRPIGRPFARKFVAGVYVFVTAISAISFYI